MELSNNLQNRKRRRSNLRQFKKQSKRAKNNWGEWQWYLKSELPNSAKEFVQDKKLLKDLKSFWVNNYLSVQVSEFQTDIGYVRRLGIRRNDEGKNITWAEKQRVKNEICGKEAVAIEVFPAKEDLIDQANMCWLWVVPKNFAMPFFLK